MNGSTTSVSTEVALWLVGPGPKAVPLIADLHYTASDPYAIQISFHVGSDEPVEWIFGRELLAVGVEHLVGDGDIRIQPSSADTLSIALSSPYGTATFEAPLADMVAFMERTYEIVTAGSEPEFIDIDAELDQLMSES